MTIHVKRFPHISSLLLACLLSACSLLPASEQVQIYRLPAITSAHHQAEKLNWSLRLMTPHANQTLDSVRIAVIPERNLISNYKGIRWSDRAPILLRDRLLDAFQTDGRIQTITSDTSTFNVDVELTSELSAFQSEYRNGKPEIRIILDMHLINSQSQQVVASHRFDVRQISKNSDAKSVIQAFGLACDNLSREVVDWTLNSKRP
ncbi:MAG: ABC-type transport auxiliary lipoprotein family protein [Tolumonas sp.]|nr:ABC-type transport auxiliary lipoprotein family protein [Tolumonas sp.]